MTNDLVLHDLEFKVEYKPSEIMLENEETLVALIDEMVKKYDSLVFTDENTDEAKKARADLNKVVKLLDDRKKEVKKGYNEPLKRFEDFIKSLSSKVKEISNSIDSGIKEQEVRERGKRKDIVELLIKEVAPNYGVETDQVEILDEWLNKGAFNAKGDKLTKKTLENITLAMNRIKEKQIKVETDIKIITGYCDAYKLDSSGWVSQVQSGATSVELMPKIDAYVKRKADEEAIQTRLKQDDLDCENKIQYEKELQRIKSEETIEIDTDLEKDPFADPFPNVVFNVEKVDRKLFITATEFEIAEIQAFLKEKNIIHEFF